MNDPANSWMASGRNLSYSQLNPFVGSSLSGDPAQASPSFTDPGYSNVSPFGRTGDDTSPQSQDKQAADAAALAASAMGRAPDPDGPFGGFNAAFGSGGARSSPSPVAPDYAHQGWGPLDQSMMNQPGAPPGAPPGGLPGVPGGRGFAGSGREAGDSSITDMALAASGGGDFTGFGGYSGYGGGGWGGGGFEGSGFNSSGDYSGGYDTASGNVG